MTWIYQLYDTYNNNVNEVGITNTKRNGQEYTLLPIAHTTQTAHIQVDITPEGQFHSSNLISKEQGITLIPATESAASRAGSKVAPYPLHDKIGYCAGDFVKYTHLTNKAEQYQAYIKQLGDWANSEFSHWKIKSIYDYLKKGCLIEDLIADHKLAIDGNHFLFDKWSKDFDHLYDNKPDLFQVATSGQHGIFVRFNVFSANEQLTSIWNDKEIYDSFINHYSSRQSSDDVCLVTGENAPITTSHANKIRNSADKAKLISSNDTSGFTFRGRFEKASDAASISYEASQKAHNALKWLINKQGKYVNGRIFLVWENKGSEIADPTAPSFNVFPSKKTMNQGFTNAQIANEFAKAISGYIHDLSSQSQHINILVLDAATTGRLAILYYRSLDKEDYFNRLLDWHSSAMWIHTYRNEEGQYQEYRGVPSVKDIAQAAYGQRADEKIVKGFMERMLPTIIEGRKVPQDIVTSLFHRASNPVGLEDWEWRKTLGIACSMINTKEGYDVRVSENEMDRSYLFGRLLAIADVFERNALGREETRASNAIRYMNSFSRQPARTWKTIQSSLQPYQAKMGGKSTYFTKQIDDIASRISPEDFNNKPLSEKYLLGFYSQRYDLYQKKSEKTTISEEE